MNYFEKNLNIDLVDFINSNTPNVCNPYGDTYVIQADNYATLEITLYNQELIDVYHDYDMEISLVDNSTKRVLISIQHFTFRLTSTPLLEMYHFLKFAFKTNAKVIDDSLYIKVKNV